MTLAEAAARAATSSRRAGSERELAELRAKWDDELEGAARSADFRERAVAFRAIGQFRWRAKEELLRRGLDDGSPAARGSALLSVELLSRDHPSTVNRVRPLLHTLADEDENAAVRRLAVLCAEERLGRSATRSCCSRGSPPTTRPTRSCARGRQRSRRA